MNFELVYGILIAVLWGIGDFLLKKAVETANIANVILFRLLAMSVLFGLAFLFSPFEISLNTNTAFLLIAAGTIYALSTFLSYKALENGKVSIMAAIFASYSIVVVILSILLLGEQLSVAKIIAGITIAVGVALACLKKTDFQKRKWIAVQGSKFAIACAVCVGLSQFLLKPLGQQFGVLSSLFFMTVISMALTVPFFLKSKRTKISFSAAQTILLVAAFYVAGDILYVQGVKTHLASIIAPIASTFPIVVLGLAYFIRKERLEVTQLAGIALVVVGTAVVSGV